MNRKGLSLIEVMIAMGVMSIVGLAMSNMFMEQLKSNNFLEDQLSKSQVSNDLKILTMNTEACRKTLSTASPPLLALGAVGTAQDINFIRNNLNLNNVVLQTNTDYNKLTVKQMKLFNESIGAGDSSGTVRIEVPLARKRTGGGTNHLKVVQSVYVTIDPVTRMITGCSNSAITPASVRTFSVSEGTNPTARAECAADEIRLSCAGGRNPTLTDTCNEDDCGFVGVKPDGDRACIASVDDDIGTDVTVWITCFKYM